MPAKTNRRVGRKTLEVINEGLEEISAYFGWESASTESAQEEVEKPKGEHLVSEAKVDVEEIDPETVDDEYDDSYEEIDSGDGWVDKEEVEVAVDAFISALLSAGIIRKSKSGKLPSFEDVFERFFDENDEIIELARRFEKSIQGYFDWISPDDLDSARDCFLGIRDLLQERIGAQFDVN